MRNAAARALLAAVSPFLVGSPAAAEYDWYSEDESSTAPADADQGDESDGSDDGEDSDVRGDRSPAGVSGWA
jgi:hypothetical protein